MTIWRIIAIALLVQIFIQASTGWSSFAANELLDATNSKQSNETGENQPEETGASQSDATAVPAQRADQFQQKQQKKLPFSLQVEHFFQSKGQERDSRFTLSEEAIQLLSRFQLELVIDRSLSMGERDCPGLRSRWAWCGAQAEDLATAIAPYSKEGITITSFAWNYDVCEGASAERIEQVFRHLPITPGTRLAAPLKDRLDHFFANRNQDQRPLLLAIVTDGIPFPPPEPSMVRHVLAKLTKKVKTPGEVTVVFLQIGKLDWLGRAYLHSLEKNIGTGDSKRPLIQCVSFKEIQSVGLGNALAHTVEKSSSTGK